jgi:hypothetical protein
VYANGQASFFTALGGGGAPYTRQEFYRTFFISAPATPITETQVYFGWGSQTFSAATLMLSVAGSLSAFTAWIGFNVAEDSSAIFRDAASIIVGSSPFVPSGFASTAYGSAGVSPSGTHPNAWPAYNGPVGTWVMPSKVWVRFKNGPLFSEPTEVTLSLPDATLAVNQGVFTYDPRRFYTLDVSKFVQAEVLDVLNVSTPLNIPYDVAAQIAGLTSYEHLGGTFHRLKMEALDPNGDAITGFVRSSRYLIEPQKGN